MANIVLPTQFDCEKIGFDDMKINNNGGKVVYMKYGDTQRVTMQTPKITAPFGLSEYRDDKTGSVKYSIDVSFKGMESDSKIQTFFDKMKALDEAVINTAIDNSKEWFGKKMKREVIEELYRPVVKPAKDPEKYAPTMKFKLQSNNQDELMVEAFDSDKNKINIIDTFKPGSKLRGIVECSSIWFVNKQFGVTWRALQVEVTKSDKISGFSFVPEDDEYDTPEIENEYPVEETQEDEDDDEGL